MNYLSHKRIHQSLALWKLNRSYLPLVVLNFWPTSLLLLGCCCHFIILSKINMVAILLLMQ